jgi:hypothetical protein
VAGGEKLLREIERSAGGRLEGNSSDNQMSFSASVYRQALQGAGLKHDTAHRWQVMSLVPAPHAAPSRSPPPGYRSFLLFPTHRTCTLQSRPVRSRMRPFFRITRLARPRVAPTLSEVTSSSPRSLCWRGAPFLPSLSWTLTGTFRTCQGGDFAQSTKQNTTLATRRV